MRETYDVATIAFTFQAILGRVTDGARKAAVSESTSDDGKSEEQGGLHLCDSVVFAVDLSLLDKIRILLGSRYCYKDVVMMFSVKKWSGRLRSYRRDIRSNCSGETAS